MAFPLRRAACALLGLLPFGAWGVDASVVPPLSAHIMTTVQYAHGDIYYRTPPGEGPRFAAGDEVVAEQRLDVVVMGTGAARDDAGKVNVVYDLRVRAPDGSTVKQLKDLRLAVDRSAPAIVTLFPTDIATFVVKSDEPMGEYRLDVTVRDRVSGASAFVTKTIVASADNTPLPWPENTDAHRWLATYYLQPQPRLLIPGLIQLGRRPEVRTSPPQSQGPLLGFSEQVLKDNPWLIPQMQAHLRKTDDEWEERTFSLILAYVLRDRPGELEDGLKDLVKTLPRESPEPMNGIQLDLWWGRFLGGGHFEPVGKLVSVIEKYRPYRPAYDAYLARLEPRGQMSSDERRGLLHATALWSLGSNARQHKRIAHYLTTLRGISGTSDTTKAIIDEAFAEPAPARPGRPSQSTEKSGLR